MTFEASRLTVLAMTAPQPSLKARLMTLRLVPGGPEPMTKGLGSFRPSTVVASVGMAGSGVADSGGKGREREWLGGTDSQSCKIQMELGLAGTMQETTNGHQ